MNNDYVRSLIERGKRIDGRSLDSYREIKLESGISKYAEGSARCKIGETEVLVGVKIELGPPNEQSVELARVVDRGIRESKAVDFKKLCIKEGEKIFMRFIDIQVINDDGNLIDASALGALKALSEAKFPKLDKDNKVVSGEFSGKLKLEKLPITCTVYKIGGSLLVDVDSKEEKAVDARLSVNVGNGRIHALQKGKDIGFSVDEIGRAVDIAVKKEKELAKLLK